MAEATSKEPTTKKVRVLIAHGDHLPNHVLTLSIEDAAQAVEDGWADDNPAAVAYALKHEPQPETAKKAEKAD